MTFQIPTHLALAADITRSASKQTFYTIRFLVDKDRIADAFRAYAYFRWVDDTLDQATISPAERLAFVHRQQHLLERCYSKAQPSDLTPEERLLAELIHGDCEQHSGLQAYIRNMMSVMTFDANRRRCLISQQELRDYTHWLAVAVTEALHHFIGYGEASPQSEARYQAATGAHIVHMLRDALDDAEAGYFNIPREVLTAHRITPWEVKSNAYRAWVKERIQEARLCFQAGRKYLAEVENLRCRIAGYAYLRRFEIVLDHIESEQYLLRAAYPERKGRRCSMELIGWALWMALRHPQPVEVSPLVSVR